MIMTTTEILTGVKNWVSSKLSLKQDVINDLAAIRSGSQAGSTAVQPSDLSSYFNNASYDTNTHRINFYHGQNIVAYVDASPFIVDGMVNDVRIENGYLVIDFNTDSGKQDISIPLADIFNPNNYYTKSETDLQFTQKQSEIDDLYARIGYYVCSTDGNVAAKTIVANNYTLGNGGSIKVKMTNANTADNATLNINSTGAKALYYAGERASTSNSWKAGETIEVYYDGTNFMANNVAGGSGGGEFATGEKVSEVGIDNEPVAESQNLLKSGGAAKINLYLGQQYDITNSIVLHKGYIERSGTITAYNTWYYGVVLLKAHQTITVDNTNIGSYPSLGIAQSENVGVGDVVTVLIGKSYTAESDNWIVISAGTHLNSVKINSNDTIYANVNAVYDISAFHGGDTYDNLTTALGVNGANVPINNRHDSMSVKFIQNSYATYSVVKTGNLNVQPTGIMIESAPAVTDGIYIAAQLTDFSNAATLPATVGSSVTYYAAIIETVDGEEVTTYIQWTIFKYTDDSAKYISYRYKKVYENTTAGNNEFICIGNWEEIKYDDNHKANYIENKNIDGNGIIYNNNGTFITTKIPVKSGNYVTYNFYTGETRDCKVCFFTDSDEFITYYSANTSGTRTIIAPENSYYMIVSFQETYIYKQNIKINGVIVWEKEDDSDIVELSKEVSKIAAKIDTQLYNLKKADIINIQSVNEIKIIKTSVEAGTVSFPIYYQFHKDETYKIKVYSDVSTSGGTLLRDYNNTVISNKRLNLLKDPIVCNYVSSGYYNRFYVLVDSVSAQGTIIVEISVNENLYVDRNYAKKKVGANLCDPLKVVYGAVLEGELKFASSGLVNNFVSDWIPIKAGQTLACNVRASSETFFINGLFKNYGDTIPVKTSTYTYSDYSTITNDLGYDAYAVFTIGNFNINTSRVIINVGVTPKNYLPYNEIGGYIETEDDVDYSSYGSIGINYPEEVVDENNVLSQGTAVRFVHISDTHGNGNARFAYDFTDASSADFLVHTGDIVSDKFSDGFDQTLALSLAHIKPTFFVLGNHDCYQSGTTQAVFDKFISPLNDHNDLTGNTKTYYSKDFDTAKVKCIFMNQSDGEESVEHNMSYYCHGIMTDAQISWLIAQLKDAITKSYSVAIFIHQQPCAIGNFKDDWTDDIVSYGLGNTCISVIVDAFMRGTSFSVTNGDGISTTGTLFEDSFSGKGGFSGYFCGHAHADQVGTSIEYPMQRINIIARPEFSFDPREGCTRTPTNERANYVTIDGTKRLVCVYRLGSQMMRCGSLRKSYQYVF